MYYLDVAGDGELTVHRGDKSGPVIAASDPCAYRTESVTDIRFFDATGDIRLEHMPHKILHKHSDTRFTYGTKGYHWIGLMGLVDDTTDALIAVFHSSWFGNSSSKVGRLEITSEGRKLVDLVVITALILQEKAAEVEKGHGNQAFAT